MFTREPVFVFQKEQITGVYLRFHSIVQKILVTHPAEKKRSGTTLADLTISNAEQKLKDEPVLIALLQNYVKLDEGGK